MKVMKGYTSYTKFVLSAFHVVEVRANSILHYYVMVCQLSWLITLQLPVIVWFAYDTTLSIAVT